MHHCDTAKAADAAAAEAMLTAEEAGLRRILGGCVFGVDEQTMEAVVLALLRRHGMNLAVAEAVTGGLMAARLSAAPGAGEVFRGAVVSGAPEVRASLFGVPEADPVATPEAVEAMADGVRRALCADAGLATAAVVGSTAPAAPPVGAVVFGLALPSRLDAERVQLPGGPDRIREYAVISGLDFLRRGLLGLEGPTQ